MLYIQLVLLIFFQKCNYLDNVKARKELFLLGDFNGRVSSQENNGEDKDNNNGEISFEQFDLEIWNCFSQEDSEL